MASLILLPPFTCVSPKTARYGEAPAARPFGVNSNHSVTRILANECAPAVAEIRLLRGKCAVPQFSLPAGSRWHRQAALSCDAASSHVPP